MKDIEIKRVYDKRTKEDGRRILIDRLWPRGLSKEDAHVDEWIKELAPSTELRKWFNHKPELFEEFSKRYKKELKEHCKELDDLKELVCSNLLDLECRSFQTVF